MADIKDVLIKACNDLIDHVINNPEVSAIHSDTKILDVLNSVRSDIECGD